MDTNDNNTAAVTTCPSPFPAPSCMSLYSVPALVISGTPVSSRHLTPPIGVTLLQKITSTLLNIREAGLGSPLTTGTTKTPSFRQNSTSQPYTDKSCVDSPLSSLRSGYIRGTASILLSLLKLRLLCRLCLTPECFLLPQVTHVSAAQ
ncbi:hypothetical protein WAI453_005145 [Rhynchosporium graminicola]